MADKEPIATVDETAPDGLIDDDASQAASSAFSFDEQTLGRSTSVFDSADFAPPAAPPLIQPAPQAYPEEPEVVRERALSPRERRRRVRLEARRVRRVVRHIEPWSVLKISLLFYFCLWLIFVLAGVLLWSFAEESGTLESIEDLVESLFALDSDGEFWSGGTIFRAYALGTLILFIAGVTFNVLLCVLYNLISDLTGGIRITVIEEETARFTPPKRRRR